MVDARTYSSRSFHAKGGKTCFPAAHSGCSVKSAPGYEPPRVIQPPADGFALELLQVREAMKYSCEFSKGAEFGPSKVQKRDSGEGGEEYWEMRMERDIWQRLGLR